MAMQVLMLIVMLIITPICVGFIPANLMDKDKRNIGLTYIYGMLLIWSVFQFLTVALMFQHSFGFRRVVPAFTAILAILSVAGVVWAVLNYKRGEWELWISQISHRKRTVEEKLQWTMFIILLGLQLYMAFAYASFDGDDAYYVVQSVATCETDTMYRVLPYTGLSTAVDIRHGLAPFPIWISYISRMSGVHPTIICHTVLQFVLIPMSYFIYYEIGKCLLSKEKQKLPIFMVIVAVLQIFGNVSIYTNATFFLTRTWQGKSILANVMLPLVFLVLYWIGTKEQFTWKQGGLGMLLVMVNMSAALSSTASVFLMSLLIGVQGIVMAIMKKNLMLLVELALTCIPCVVYALMYVLI